MIKANLNLAYKIINSETGLCDYYLGDLTVRSDDYVCHKMFTCTAFAKSELVSLMLERQLLDIIQKWGDDIG
jgi:hypothetical protein